MLYFFSSGPAAVLQRFVDLPPYVFQWISFLIGLASTLLLVVFVGAVTRNFVGRKLLLFTESVISRIPLARTFYISVKQVVQTFFFTSRSSHRK